MSFLNYHLEKSHSHHKVRISFNMPNGRKKYWLLERVDPEKWDRKKQRHKSNQSLNNFLNELESVILKDRRELLLVRKFTWHNLKKRLDKFFNEAGESTRLLDWFDEFVDRKKADPDLKSTYENTFNMIRSKIEDYDKDIELGSIDSKWYLSFMNHLKTKYASSTASQVNSILKECLNLAFEEDKMDYNPKKIRPKIRVHKKVNVRLTLDEVDQIRNKRLSGYFEYIRKEFLLCCLTGARYSDNYLFNESYIRGNELIYYPEKGRYQSKVKIPVTEEMRKLITTLPLIRLQHFIKSHKEKYSRILKLVCKECGVDSKITIPIKGELQTIEKWTQIKPHTSRRTFMCIQRDLGCNIGEIQNKVGHSTMQQTERYLESVV